MSEQIDWSKAPEGATHYVPAPNDLHHPIWLKMDGKTVLNAGYIGHDHWAHTYTRGSQPCTDLSNAIARPTTPSWSGEGLPPVGVVCEANFVGIWVDFELRYYGESYVIFKTSHEVQRTRIDFDTCGVKFRPIRTPEQIAADEREAAIEQIEGIIAGFSYRHCAELIHDAGYRKAEVNDAV